MDATAKQLASAMGVSLSTVYRVFVVLGHRYYYYDRSDVLLLRESGLSIRDIAYLLNVSKTQVWRILNND